MHLHFPPKFDTGQGGGVGVCVSYTLKNTVLYYLISAFSVLYFIQPLHDLFEESVSSFLSTLLKVINYKFNFYLFKVAT